MTTLHLSPESEREIVAQAVAALCVQAGPKVDALLSETMAVKMSIARKMVGCGKTTMWKLCSTGQLKVTPFGTVSVQSIRDYVNGKPAKAKGCK